MILINVMYSSCRFQDKFSIISNLQYYSKSFFLNLIVISSFIVENYFIIWIRVITNIIPWLKTIDCILRLVNQHQWSWSWMTKLLSFITYTAFICRIRMIIISMLSLFVNTCWLTNLLLTLNLNLINIWSRWLLGLMDKDWQLCRDQVHLRLGYVVFQF